MSRKKKQRSPLGCLILLVPFVLYCIAIGIGNYVDAENKCWPNGLTRSGDVCDPARHADWLREQACKASIPWQEKRPFGNSSKVEACLSSETSWGSRHHPNGG